MKELEKEIIHLINEMERKEIYVYNEYQLLHIVPYRKKLDDKYIEQIRKQYADMSIGAACELKSYYSDNGIPSNTIVLKMRPSSPDIAGFVPIKIHSDVDGTDHLYTHHALEIFKEHGRFKVLDVIHRNETLWLESFLDEVCKVNICKRSQLRYDMGYLAPLNSFTDNMYELCNLMHYLDRVYNIGQPRLNMCNSAGSSEKTMFLSNDIVMDFDEFGRQFNTSAEEVLRTWQMLYGIIKDIRFNMLAIMCKSRMTSITLFEEEIESKMFDDETIEKLVENILNR